MTYQYTWEPAIWSKYYSEAPEILKYFKDVVDKFGLRKYIKLHHSIDRAEWNQESGKWTISISDLESGNKFEDGCDIFLNAGGPLKYVLFSQHILC